MWDSHIKTKVGNVETVKYVNSTPGSPKEIRCIRMSEKRFTRDSMYKFDVG